MAEGASSAAALQTSPAPPRDQPRGAAAQPGGLTSAEAEERLKIYGPNEAEQAARPTPLFAFLHFCANPLVLILVAATIVSAIAGEVADAAIILVIVVFSIVLNFIQAYRSDLAVKRLRSQVAPTATVLRDGKWIELARRELVPGDLIRLSAGDLVPADARLVESRDLHVMQAALTGESMPAEKQADPAAADSISPEAPHMVFLGTSIVSGAATALVVATGPRTAFGDIARHLAAPPPETEFERGTRRFGLLIMETVAFLVLFIVMVNVALRRDPIESLLFAVALAVGLTPEFLPMITTVTLAAGAVRMARKRVIVKHLESIENFGSIDILCSDKTGTLTAGVMSLDCSLDPFGRPDERTFELARINSYFETGIRSPLDAAILARKAGAPEGWRKTDEIPFDFTRRRLSIAAERDGVFMLVTKGAPEHVLEICTSLEVAGASHPMTPEERARTADTFRALSADGLRVLALCRRTLERGDGLAIADERDMTLAGYLAFLDPPRADAAAALAALSRDGVALKILTGDNELVARHVCAQVGIDAERIVLGSELDRISDSALGQVAEQVSIFARVSPGQKNRLIRALKVRGHVVGFLGDGINDAPSLHAADVGISVAGAVDVAKDAAAIILLESDLGLLHSGIIEGRKAFGNVLKYLLMATSSNFGNMFSMAGASLFLPFLPMMPTQILLNNFLYDLSQVAIPTDRVDPAYIRRPQKWDIRLIRDFMVLIGPISSIYDFLTFYILLAWFHAPEALFHTGWFVESLATQTLVVFVIRTVGRPWTDRPSIPLAATTLGAVIVGTVLPFSQLAALLGLKPLPVGFFVFLTLAAASYLALVELVKGWLIRRHIV
jgi:P-type Mg2+ transporter